MRASISQFLSCAVAIAIFSLTLACTGKKSEKQPSGLMVSIEPQRWLLEQLADSGTHISVMLDRGANPETFEPSMSKRIQADEAEAYFATGALPFENALRNSSRTLFVDTSEGIEPIYGTHSHHHHDSESHHHAEEAPDPHIWTSVSGIRTMARNMAKALTKNRPEKAEAIDGRLHRLEQRLDSLDNAIKSKFADSRAEAFAVWHPSLSYFARDYGLHQIAVGQESKEISARQVREMIDMARADSVKVFFFQKEYDSRQARSINDEIGSRMVYINPLDYDIIKQMTLIADELSRP